MCSGVKETNEILWSYARFGLSTWLTRILREYPWLACSLRRIKKVPLWLHESISNFSASLRAILPKYQLEHHEVVKIHISAIRRTIPNNTMQLEMKVNSLDCCISIFKSITAVLFIGSLFYNNAPNKRPRGIPANSLLAFERCCQSHVILGYVSFGQVGEVAG